MPGEKPDPARHAFLRLSAGALALVAVRGALAQFHERGGRGAHSGRGGAEGQQPSTRDRLDETLREFHDDLALTAKQQQRANPRLAGIVEMVAGDVPAAPPAQEKRERADCSAARRPQGS